MPTQNHRNPNPSNDPSPDSRRQPRRLGGHLPAVTARGRAVLAEARRKRADGRA